MVITLAVGTMARFDQDTINTVAATIFREAAGESFAGKMGVASVIWTRAEHSPAHLLAVVRARNQFAGWDKRTLRIPADYPSERAWRECQHIAGLMVHGGFEPTLTAWHFHDDRMDGPAHDWGNPQFVKKIGRLKFYRKDGI